MTRVIITSLQGLALTPDRIRALREDAGMTQAELARRLGITRSSVNGWEMGLALPSTALLVELARTFHVSTDYLLGLENGAVLCMDGLSDREVAAVRELVDCLHARK